MPEEIWPAADASLVVRNAPGKLLGLALGSLAFVIVGVLMLTTPPPSGWSPALAGIVGVLSVLFGLAGLVTAIQAARRPVLLLGPDQLFDVRRRMTIPFADIRAVAINQQPGNPLARWLTPQWLLLTLRNPAEYAIRGRFSDADVVLDLSLTSAGDYMRVYQSLSRMVNQSFSRIVE